MDQVFFPDAGPRDQIVEDTTRDERSFRGPVGSPVLLSAAVCGLYYVYNASIKLHQAFAVFV